jgi:hypothetical protein
MQAVSSFVPNACVFIDKDSEEEQMFCDLNHTRIAKESSRGKKHIFIHCQLFVKILRFIECHACSPLPVATLLRHALQNWNVAAEWC